MWIVSVWNKNKSWLLRMYNNIVLRIAFIMFFFYYDRRTAVPLFVCVQFGTTGTLNTSKVDWVYTSFNSMVYLF